MSNFFQGKIVFHFGQKGTGEKVFEFNFSPAELCFQKALVPIFLTDLKIPTNELKFLTKETRSLILKIKNLELDLLKSSIADLENEIRDYSNDVVKIQAYGIGSLIALLLPIKKTAVTCIDYPVNLLPKELKKKIARNSKIAFSYSDDFILKPIVSLCPVKKSTKGKMKRKVAA